MGCPCSHGGHFVDPEARTALRLWIEAAQEIRATCGNLVEFDALIAGQRARLDAM